MRTIFGHEYLREQRDQRITIGHPERIGREALVGNKLRPPHQRTERLELPVVADADDDPLVTRFERLIRHDRRMSVAVALRHLARGDVFLHPVGDRVSVEIGLHVAVGHERERRSLQRRRRVALLTDVLQDRLGRARQLAGDDLGRDLQRPIARPAARRRERGEQAGDQ